MFFDQPTALTTFLDSFDTANCNVLMMSSGNFGGINLVDLADKLLKNNLLNKF